MEGEKGDIPERCELGEYGGKLLRRDPHERRVLDQTQFPSMGCGQMKPYKIGVKMGLVHGPPPISPDMGFPNHRRYDQGSVAVICTTIAAKSHFNARFRHTFETNEHCLSEDGSS